MYRVMIVDDEFFIRKSFRNRINWASYQMEVVGEAANGEQAWELIPTLRPDLMFVDIRMPVLDGFDLATLLRDEYPDIIVIIISAYNDFQYARKAIENGVFDYLLKPPSPQDLAQTMTRFYEDKLASLPQAAGPAEQRQPRILVVNAMNEHIALRDADVAFFRFDADGKHWEAVCTNGSTYILRSRTNSDFILRYSPSFVQIHKRYIVNVSHIMMIQDNTCILGYPYEDNRELKVSKNYRRDLMDAFYTL